MLAFVHVKKFKLISCHFKKSEKDCYTFWYYFFFSDVISVKCIFVVSIHNSTYREISVFIDMYTRIEQWAQTIYGFVYVKNILEFLLSIPFFGNLFYVFTSQNDSLYFCHLLFFCVWQPIRIEWYVKSLKCMKMFAINFKYLICEWKEIFLYVVLMNQWVFSKLLFFVYETRRIECIFTIFNMWWTK